MLSAFESRTNFFIKWPTLDKQNTNGSLFTLAGLSRFEDFNNTLLAPINLFTITMPEKWRKFEKTWHNKDNHYDRCLTTHGWKTDKNNLYRKCINFKRLLNFLLENIGCFKRVSVFSWQKRRTITHWSGLMDETFVHRNRSEDSRRRDNKRIKLNIQSWMLEITMTSMQNP